MGYLINTFKNHIATTNFHRTWRRDTGKHINKITMDASTQPENESLETRTHSSARHHDAMDSVRDTLNPPVSSLLPNSAPVGFRTINKSTLDAFQKESLAERLKIRHLEIVGWLEFRSQTITIVNNIEILTIDWSQEHEKPVDPVYGFLVNLDDSPSGPSLGDPRSLVKAVINASMKQGKSQVKKVIFKKAKDILEPKHWLRRSEDVIIGDISLCLGVEFKEHNIVDEEINIWVWEAADGDTLTWSRRNPYI
jgi:hypothetical protein